jgi:hypothetical protein
MYIGKLESPPSPIDGGKSLGSLEKLDLIRPCLLFGLITKDLPTKYQKEVRVFASG